ncbi:prostaglandin F2 receptor negative regulator-like [Pristis pectinata]|uniref:prostaglandin F2 receptor negative regulator-like n=1 Tax=Pristis pectinata TaxID=685728 RepID=UPI00223CD217|nr:prostaglandin F2 receptor negative regulator-like [Pristis pectinata]
MRRSVWFLLLLQALNWGLTLGRIVKVPFGPLYRVVKTPVSIPCNVSDYQGPPEQNFDWIVLRNHRQSKIISTLEPEFSDPEYKEKVLKNEIWVERLSDNSVELRFKSAQFEDDGEYQCQTPSTDENSSGNYEASVTLKVIPDKLTVLPTKSRSMTSTNYTEGRPLELQCVASTSSPVSTHLSVKWQLTKNGGVTEDILSFTEDDQFLPGGSYANRYQRGDIRMALEKNGIFKLIIGHLQLEDSGVYSCMAAEWVKEDGSKWKKIQEKSTSIATIEVQPLAQTLKVSASGGILTLNKGDEIDLVCSVTGVEDFSVEISWYFSTSPAVDTQSGKLLVHMNLAAIVNDSNFVTLNKISSSDYRLRVQQVDEADSGYYYCAASVWIPYSNELRHKAAEKTSNPLNITVALLDPTYTVQLSSMRMPSSSGEPAELECQVSDVQNADDARLNVAWYFKPIEPDGVARVSVLIAMMDQDWILKVSDQYNERAKKGEVTFTKPKLHTFKFQMQHASASDRGEYFCNVSAWMKQRGDTWLKKQELSSFAVDMFWKIEDPSLSITATEEKPVATRGNTFEMACSISAEHVELPYYSVVIAMNEPAFTDAKDSKKLISLSRDSVVKLEQWDVKDRPEDLVLEKVSDKEFRFRLYKTQFSDEGSYYCMVQAWVPDANGGWSEVISNYSNAVAVAFKTAAPRFYVTLESERPHVYQGETLEMNCTVDLPEIPNTSDVLYEVEWFFQRLPLNATLNPLVSMDQRSVVTYFKDFDTSGISVERTDINEFRLRIHCSDNNFSGDFFCKVAPWIKSETGIWQKIEPQESGLLSVRVDISVLDSFKMPLLYGIGSALLIGILACAIGYCAFPSTSRGRAAPTDERRGLLQKCLS